MATRASFTLQTPLTIKCVHILGSWDLYRRQLPLTKIKQVEDTYEWNNTFEFQVTTLQPGKRYWYYVCMVRYEANPVLTSIIVFTQWISGVLRLYKSHHDRTHNWPHFKYL
jgi:hypothetical protein